MASWQLAIILALAAAAAGCSVCEGDMCCNIPSDNQYYLTDFCTGPGTMSCGEHCGYTQYFTADRQRFGCGKYLHICGNGRCLKAQVADAGPANWVEDKAGGPIIDASQPVCQYISGHGSCGWSDHVRITAVLTADDDPRPLGPFRVTREEYRAIVGDEVLAREEALGLYKPDLDAAVCCTPDQYQGYSFSWDIDHGHSAGMNISYDYTNQRFSLRIFGADDRRHERLLESIVLFKTKKAYTIDWESKTCHSQNITHTMEQDCVPSTAQVRGKPTIGGTLPAIVVQGREGDSDVYETRAASNCFPIESVATHQQYGISTTNFFDFTQGIANPDEVFAIPSFCSSQSMPESELTRALAAHAGNLRALATHLPPLLFKRV